MDNKLPLEVWVLERLENAERIAEKKTGGDKAGWLEDAEYFRKLLSIVVQIPEREWVPNE